MSQSYKKQPYFSANAGKMKKWKQNINRSYRSNCKQILNTTENWDSLLLPVLRDSRDRWYYPKSEGSRWRKIVPAINQCEVDFHQLQMRSPSLVNHKYYRLNKEGHKYNCNCYINKKSEYWKMMRK